MLPPPDGEDEDSLEELIDDDDLLPSSDETPIIPSGNEQLCPPPEYPACPPSKPSKPSKPSEMKVTAKVEYPRGVFHIRQLSRVPESCAALREMLFGLGGVVPLGTEAGTIDLRYIDEDGDWCSLDDEHALGLALDCMTPLPKRGENHFRLRLQAMRRTSPAQHECPDEVKYSEQKRGRRSRWDGSTSSTRKTGSRGFSTVSPFRKWKPSSPTGGRGEFFL